MVCALFTLKNLKENKEAVESSIVELEDKFVHSSEFYQQ